MVRISVLGDALVSVDFFGQPTATTAAGRGQHSGRRACMRQLQGCCLDVVGAGSLAGGGTSAAPPLRLRANVQVFSPVFALPSFPLSTPQKSMYNAEKRGKKQVLIRPSSKVVIKVLQVMMKHGYIGEFEFVDNHRSGKIVVELNGRLNKCGVISPRYDISPGDIEDWVGRLLPSRQFGFFIMTTSQGIMDHEEARRKKVGGKVISFFY